MFDLSDLLHYVSFRKTQEYILQHQRAKNAQNFSVLLITFKFFTATPLTNQGTQNSFPNNVFKLRVI